MNKFVALVKRNVVKVATSFVAFGTMVGLVCGNSFADSLCNSLLTAATLATVGCITLIAHYKTSSVK